MNFFAVGLVAGPLIGQPVKRPKITSLGPKKLESVSTSRSPFAEQIRLLVSGESLKYNSPDHTKILADIDSGSIKLDNTPTKSSVPKALISTSLGIQIATAKIHNEGLDLSFDATTISHNFLVSDGTKTLLDEAFEKADADDQYTKVVGF